MPIILLSRIIFETAVCDIQTAELIEKFKKIHYLIVEKKIQQEY